MQYPDRLIPQIYFKQIQEDLSAFFLCRAVNSKNLLEKINGLYRHEVLCENHKEFFDYSTNLLGHFLPEDTNLVLTGDNKKYFYTYWNFIDEVLIPLYQQDFEVDHDRCFFLLPIARIHRKICLPMPSPPKKPDETLTATVMHTPNHSNFWHFSIRWVDKNGQEDKYKSAEWRNRMASTMRHTLQELINSEAPMELKQLPNHYFMKV